MLRDKARSLFIRLRLQLNCACAPSRGHQRTVRRALEAMVVSGLMSCVLFSACRADAPESPAVQASAFPELVRENLESMGPTWHFYTVSLPARYTHGTSIHPLLLDEHGERIPEKALMVAGFRRSEGRWVIPERVEEIPTELQRRRVGLGVNLELAIRERSLHLLRWTVTISSTKVCTVSGSAPDDAHGQLGEQVARWIMDFTGASTQNDREWRLEYPFLFSDGTWGQDFTDSPDHRNATPGGEGASDPAPGPSFSFARHWRWEDLHSRDHWRPAPSDFSLSLWSQGTVGTESLIRLTLEMLDLVASTAPDEDALKQCRTAVNDFVRSLARVVKEDGP